MKAKEFRKGWSHKPTPIPLNASGLWYSEECVDELLEAYVAQVAKGRQLCGECGKPIDLEPENAQPTVEGPNTCPYCGFIDLIAGQNCETFRPCFDCYTEINEKGRGDGRP